MKKEKQEEGVYFVQLNDPNILRKKILESSRETIEFLKRYEDLKFIRKEKHRNMLKLKEDTDKMIELILTLKTALPKSNIKLKDEPRQVMVEKKGVEIRKPVPTSEIEKLESELEEIESKLRSVA